MLHKKAIIAGATGLTGSYLLQYLLKDADYTEVHVLVRRSMPLEHPKLKQHLVDYDQLDAESFPKGDELFCCLGTTMKKAGSKEAFKKVDLDYVVKLLAHCEEKQISQFHVISAMGAAKNSLFFYNRVKGEMEAAVAQSPIASKYIYRPSLLLGERKEQRKGEGIGVVLARLFRPLIPKKYRAIPAAMVAKAMMINARKGEKGWHIYESDEIMGLNKT